MDYQTQMKLKRILKQPIVTYGLLAITIVVFLGMELTGGSESQYVLVQWGAMVKKYVIQNQEYWRFFTPMFLHIGWMHFAVNMITLYYVGSEVERIYGHWRYLLIHLLSGIAGNIATFSLGAAANGGISAGASTSLFGIFGAFIILGRHFRNNAAISFMVRQYATFVGINLIFNLFSSSIDMMGHVGGLIGGLLVANFLSVPNQSEKFDKNERLLSGIIFFSLFIFLLIFGFKNYNLLV